MEIMCSHTPNTKRNSCSFQFTLWDHNCIGTIAGSGGGGATMAHEDKKCLSYGTRELEEEGFLEIQ